jgi:hypothetical protein
MSLAYSSRRFRADPQVQSSIDQQIIARSRHPGFASPHPGPLSRCPPSRERTLRQHIDDLDHQFNNPKAGPPLSPSSADYRRLEVLWRGRDILQHRIDQYYLSCSDPQIRALHTEIDVQYRLIADLIAQSRKSRTDLTTLGNLIERMKRPDLSEDIDNQRRTICDLRLRIHEAVEERRRLNAEAISPPPPSREVADLRVRLDKLLGQRDAKLQERQNILDAFHADLMAMTRAGASMAHAHSVDEAVNRQAALDEQEEAEEEEEGWVWSDSEGKEPDASDCSPFAESERRISVSSIRRSNWSEI